MVKKLKLLYSKFLNFKKEVCYAFFGDKNYKKFVIISRSRTGSTLLMALLNNHPNIICDGELFKDLKGKSCKKIWDSFYRKKPKRIKQVGFKLFYYHPFNSDKEVWDYIKKEKDITIIHLVRKNMLRALVSQKIGEKTKRWTENINRPHKLQAFDKRVVLDYKECLETFTKISNYEKETRLAFSNFNFVELSYEDLVSKKAKSLEPIYDALGVDRYDSFDTVMKKQNPESVNDLVENYDKIKMKFRNSQWEDLFQ